MILEPGDYFFTIGSNIQHCTNDLMLKSSGIVAKNPITATHTESCGQLEHAIQNLDGN